MLKDYFILATSSLAKRKLRSWLTMIGIFIGIAAVVSLISLGQGMQTAIQEQFFQLGSDKVTIQTKGIVSGPPGSNSDITLTQGDVRVVQRANGVSIATDRLIEPITVEFNDATKFIYVASLPEETKERELVIEVANVDEQNMVAGRPLRSNDFWKVIMSTEYADNPKFDGKALRVGDKISINGQSVDVVGLYKKTGNPFVDGSFIMNEQPIRQLLKLPDKVGAIAAQVTPGASVPDVAETITKDLRRYRSVDEGKEDFEVQTAAEVIGTLSAILGVVTAVLVGIAGVSLLVGGVGIMNTMYTSVLERKKEIGIMKAIGARNEVILTIFLIESGFLGLLGGIIGIILGIALSKLVEIIATISLGTTLIQANFPWYLILGALLFSFGIGSLAGTFPAKQASELPPVEAMRG